MLPVPDPSPEQMRDLYDALIAAAADIGVIASYVCDHDLSDEAAVWQVSALCGEICHSHARSFCVMLLLCRMVDDAGALTIDNVAEVVCRLRREQP